MAAVVACCALPGAAAGATPRTDGSTPAPSQITQLVTNVPVSTLNKVGAGNLYGQNNFAVVPLKGKPLTSGGKPELLAGELAWCPHCAANNWGLAIALSRFGTLSDLRIINTGRYYCTLVINPCFLVPEPCYPGTDGLSFFDTKYKSRYLKFGAVVLQDVEGHNLQEPTKQEGKLLHTFDPGGSFPADDIGGAYGFVGPAFDPGALRHKTWAQIAGSLADPSNSIAKRVDGFANLFTAAICKTTDGRPASVCKSSGVIAAGAARLG
jgi:hypothetical protein